MKTKKYVYRMRHDMYLSLRRGKTWNFNHAELVEHINATWGLVVNISDIVTYS